MPPQFQEFNSIQIEHHDTTEAKFWLQICFADDEF